MSLTSPSSSVIPFQAKPSNGYLKLDHSFLKSSVWQSLPALPAAAFVEIAGRHNGYNNGQIPYSVRDGMARFHVGDRVVRRAFSQLEKSGIAVRTRKGAFDLKTREAKATEWLVHSLRTPQRPAADTTTTSDPLPADTTTTLVDKIESIGGKDSRSLARKEVKQGDRKASPDNPSSPSPLAAGGGVPRGPFIPFDSPKWPLVEKHARSILGFVPPGGRGWQFTNEEWAAIEAAAIANGGGVS